MAIHLMLPEPPSANRWWRKFRNRMVLSPEARTYKAMVAARCPRTPLTGPVAVTLCWTRARRSGDLDKRLGVVLDALQGVAYHNDQQVVAIHATRRDGQRAGKHQTAEPARIEVTVEAV